MAFQDNKSELEAFLKGALGSESAVAQYTDTSVSYWQKNRLIGGCPFIKIGKSVRYRRADVDNYLASRARTSTSQAA